MTSEPGKIIEAAEVLLPSGDLKDDLPFFTKRLGFRMDTIFPADDPSVAVLSGYGIRLRLDREASAAPGTLRLLCKDPGAIADGERELIAPNGTRIELADAEVPLSVPETKHQFVVRRLKDEAPWVIGRSGMRSR